MGLEEFFKRTRRSADGTEISVEHVDTNILIRYIVRDDPKSVKKVEALFSTENTLFSFEDAAMMEVVFVLEKKYAFSRQHIVQNIKNLMAVPNLIFNSTIIGSALDVYATHPKLSFVDCYQAIIAEASGEIPLWTFDRKLAAQCPIAKVL